MNPNSPRPWYKKKRYILASVAAVAVMGMGGLQGDNTNQYTQGTQVVAPASQFQVNAQNTVQKVVPTSQKTPELSNDNYYTNTYGNSVHSPTYTQDNSIPIGASARCRDDTYSFSQSRKGTCSHHGGVDSWL